MMLMERLAPEKREQASAQAAVAALHVRSLSKTYPGASLPAVDDFSFDVGRGEVVALLGPSGCGKTTVLRMIAGLERPDGGTIEIDGRTVSGPRAWVAPDRRGVGMVFQDYALFPHLTVRGNVAYGLNKLSRSERRERMHGVLALTGLDQFAKRYPHELSGGQQQRVAIARAIAPRPALVLLDEPFSNLDVGMREQVRSEALALLRAAGVSVVLVTHDQDEAFVAAERIAVMDRGRLHQAGTAEELYFKPQTRFVAQFVGVANFLPAGLHGDLRVSPAGDGASAEILLRPEQIEVADQGLAATVVEREFHGHDWLYLLRAESGHHVRVITQSAQPLAVGTHVHVRSRIDRAPAFPAPD
jgi:iron(III) transport system ATP-binding protein